EATTSRALRDLLDAGTEVVCLVGKAWDLHVTQALRPELDEGVAMVRDSVAFLRDQGRRVFFDAEHFFDGYVTDPAFAMRVLAAAEEAGAERLVLCDTNGGMLPFDVARIVTAVAERTNVPLGIHVHNDAGCAVANSLIAVDAGVFQVQGTINGYGERTGNADLIPITADLVLKMGIGDALPAGAVEHLTELAHYVAEVANVAPDSHQPYAGRHAFTHKAGLHTSGVARLSRAYEHIDPEVVGNRRGVVASDYGGGSTVRMKADELGVRLDDASIRRAVDTMELEDFRVRVLDESVGTGAVVRVLIDMSDGEQAWTTVGVSENIIEASWEALTDGYLYGLLHPRSPEE